MKILLVATLLTIVGLTWADDYGKGHYGPYDKMEGYFQYANIPDDYSYETGWNRGNPSHHIGRYEQVQGDTFRTKVKWSDAYDGYGEHYWDYNHGPSDYKGDAGKGYYEEPKYPAAKSSSYYEEPVVQHHRPSYHDGGDVPVYTPKVYKSSGYNKPVIKSSYQNFQSRENVEDDQYDEDSAPKTLYRSSASTNKFNIKKLN